MGEAAELRKEILECFESEGDLIPAAILRVVAGSAYVPSTLGSTKAYYGYTCRALQDNKRLDGLRAQNPEIKATDTTFWITYGNSGSKITYDSDWDEQSRATTTERPQPIATNTLVVSSVLYQVIVASDMAVGVGGLFLLVGRVAE